MGFVTKIDLSNNRQVKQYEDGALMLSGATTFGLPYTGMTTGVNLNLVIVTSSYTPLLPSTFSGNSSETNFDWVDARMSAAEDKITPITPSNSGASQSVTAFTAGNTVVVDGNPIVLNYTGITFDINVNTFILLGNGTYSGTVVTNQIAFLNADSYDHKNRRIWVDVNGITRTESLTITKNVIPGYVLTCLNANGDMGLTALPSVSSGGTSNFITGFTTNGYGVATLINSVLNIPNNTYTLPTGSTSVIGGFKVGSGLSVSTDGSLNVTGDTSPSKSLNDVVLIGNSTTKDISINGIDVGLGANNVESNIRIGKNALGLASSAATSIAIGSYSQQNPSISNGNVSIGYNSMTNIDTTSYSNSLGIETLSHLIDGSFNDSFGAMSQQFSVHADMNVSMGYKTLQFVIDSNSNTSMGYKASQYVQSSNTTAIGANSFSGFYDNVNTVKTFSSTNIISDYNVTVTSHGFGTDGAQVLLRYNVTSGQISTLVDGQVYLFTVVDANTLYSSSMVKNSNVGSGRLTAQYTFLNTTTIGANAAPTQSNQVVLGDINVTQVLTNGNILSKVAVSSSDPTVNDIPSGFVSIYKNATSGDNNIWVNDNGTLIKIGGVGGSGGGTYSLPIASATILGGVKVGTGLAIDGSGILSVSGSSGGVYTASNGLIMEGSDVQLGGTFGNASVLTRDSYIDGGSHSLSIIGSPASALLIVSNPGNNIVSNGIDASGSRIGLRGTGNINSTTYTDAYGVMANNNDPTVNNITGGIKITRTMASNLVANGLGTKVDFVLPTNSAGSTTQTTSSIISKLSDAADATATSEFSITGLNNAVTSTLLAISGNGSIKLNKYGIGTFKNMSAYNLGVDAVGNTVEIDNVKVTPVSSIDYALVADSSNEELIICNSDTNAMNVALPDITTVKIGKRYTFKRLGSNTVTVNQSLSNSGNLMDYTYAGEDLLTTGDTISFMSDGTGWIITSWLRF
jgi:hypothetical protein